MYKLTSHATYIPHPQACEQLDRHARGSIRAGQPYDPLWQVRADVSRSDEVPLQEDHADRWHQSPPDVVLPARVCPHPRKHPARLPQGVVWALLRVLLRLGVRQLPLPGPGMLGHCVRWSRDKGGGVSHCRWWRCTREGSLWQIIIKYNIFIAPFS